MPLRLYNTLTRKLEDFIPADPARVTFYTCGLTVYDDGHIGNFRSFLAADLLRRWIESPLCELADGKGGVNRGPREVVHVMNITDVGHMTDDSEGGEHGEDRMAVAGRRIIEAKKSGKLPAGVEINPNDPFAIAVFYTERFLEDARQLGLKAAIDAEKDPSRMPRATANVPGMIEVIKRLIARGHAYVSGQAGSRVVYFRVKSFAPYGKLSGNTLDALKEGEGGRVSAEHQSSKEHPADFLLWKEDPRHIMSWEADFGPPGALKWGKGYPGWHIECTVMSTEGTKARQHRGTNANAGLTGWTLPNGDPVIDLHSGGEDNIFPHHECEIAQSCCAFNAAPDAGTFSKMWFHPRFLLVEGTKMSKSKQNFFTARDLFAKGIEPPALRLELIKTHYRSNANFTMQGLTDSQRMIDRWRKFAEPNTQPTQNMQPDRKGGPPTVSLAFSNALNDDLNIAGAIGTLNTWMNETPAPTQADGALMRAFDDVLGLLSLSRPSAVTSDIGLFAAGVAPDPAVIAKLEDRRAARAAKDFKKSDLIRDELLTMGYSIKDVAGGKVEVRRT